MNLPEYNQGALEAMLLAALAGVVAFTGGLLVYAMVRAAITTLAKAAEGDA